MWPFGTQVSFLRQQAPLSTIMFFSFSFPLLREAEAKLTYNSILSCRKALLEWSLITFLLPSLSREEKSPLIGKERFLLTLYSGQCLHLMLFLWDSHANLACNSNHLGNLKKFQLPRVAPQTYSINISAGGIRALDLPAPRWF